MSSYAVIDPATGETVEEYPTITDDELRAAIGRADEGLIGALEKVPGLKPGVNVAAGKVTHPAVAEGVGVEYTPVEEVLSVTA